MLLPSQYVAAAVRNVNRRLMRDCSAVLAFGEHEAKVTRASSVKRGEDEVISSELSEEIRVLALACDFPGIKKNDAVELDGDFRIVTSARRDPSGSSLYIGLSSAFERYDVGYSGPRPNGASIRGTVPCSIVNFGYEEEFQGVDGAAHGLRRITVYIRRRDWSQFGTFRPQTGDALTLRDGKTYRVASVNEMNTTLYELEARQC